MSQKLTEGIAWVFVGLAAVASVSVFMLILGLLFGVMKSSFLVGARLWGAL